jgi:hypothetical protein
MRFNRYSLSGLLFLILLTCPLYPARAEEGDIFIDPSDPTLIRRTAVPFESEILLRASDLPASSEFHPNVSFGAQSFSYLKVSPDGTRLAFSVDGSLSDWSGIYDFRSKKITQVSLSFDGEALAPYWSSDSRRVVFEQADSNHRHLLQVVDFETEGLCTLDGRSAKNRYLDFDAPWWSETGEKVYFKVEVNNGYRRSLGYKPISVPSRIGEADVRCQNVVVRSVEKFMAEVPSEPLPQEVLALSPKGQL